MQHAQIAAAKPHAKRLTGLLRHAHRVVVEQKSLQRGAHVLERGLVDGVHGGEHHARWSGEMGKRGGFGGGGIIAVVDNGVAEIDLLVVSTAQNDIADIACAELGNGDRKGKQKTQFENVEALIGVKQHHFIALIHFAVFDLDRADNALVGVVPAVADASTERVLDASLWPDDCVDDLLEDRVDAQVLLGTAAQDVVRVELQNVGNLLLAASHVRVRKIDFGDDGNDVQVLSMRWEREG